MTFAILQNVEYFQLKLLSIFYLFLLFFHHVLKLTSDAIFVSCAKCLTYGRVAQT